MELQRQATSLRLSVIEDTDDLSKYKCNEDGCALNNWEISNQE